MQVVTNLKAAPLSDCQTNVIFDGKVANRLGGHCPGPALLVATGPGLFDPLCRRLCAVPSLRWMRGSLTIMRLSDVDDSLRTQGFDDVLTLLQADSAPDAVSAAYWTVLRKATSLGMIDGRGVPASQGV